MDPSGVARSYYSFKAEVQAVPSKYTDKKMF